MRETLCLVVCLLCSGTLAQSYSEDADRMAEAYADLFRRAFQAANATDDMVTADVGTVGIRGYTCELDAEEPTSIHNLSPKYVDAVAAIGDSVTAGFGAGAKTIIGDIIEFRGLSWSIGGDKNLDEVATLPNVLRVFNPDLKGYSIKTGKASSPNARLNRAVSGARCHNMYDQAVDVVNKMPEQGVTNDDWKVITMWIGGNDLCAITSGDNTDELAKIYMTDIEKALDYFHANVPRAFVNVVMMIDVADLAVVTGITCFFVHEFACTSIKRKETLPMVSEASHLYNDELRKLINSGKYDTRDDFTVVLQPFFTETPVPRKSDGNPDKTYFAPDCFHFSQKGHAVGAKYLWNNMFEPLGAKTDHIDWHNQQDLACPVGFPYFRTSKNSILRSVGANSNDDSPSSSSGQSTNLLAILVGTGVGVLLVALAAVAVAMAMVRVRRLKRAGQGEKIQLLSFKS